MKAAIDDLRSGRMVVVVGDHARGNEAAVIVAGEFATPGAINFMATEARGVVCLALTPERCDELALRPMVARNDSALGTAFTVSIEAREGVSTGISTSDRARTIAVAIDPASSPTDVVRPGHIFPLRAREGGVLERAGWAESGVDLARLAGMNPATVQAAIMNEDGTMARGDEVAGFCGRHRLRSIDVEDLIAYRLRREQVVRRNVEIRLPTRFGDFDVVGYDSLVDDRHHVALVMGDVSSPAEVLVRLQVECVLGKGSGTSRCRCRHEVDAAMAMIAREGCGVLLYLTSQPGRPVVNDPPGRCSAPLDSITRVTNERVAAVILRDLGISRARPIVEQHGYDALAEAGLLGGRRATT